MESFRNLPVEELNEAISMGQQAAARQDLGREISIEIRSSLAKFLLARFLNVPSRDDIDLAIRYLREAVLLSEPEEPERLRDLSLLSTTLSFRYQNHKQAEDLNEAIERAVEVVRALPDESKQDANITSQLSDMYCLRYQKSSLVADLELAVAITPKDHSHRLSRWDTLSKLLHKRYKDARDEGDLTKAIQFRQEALAMTSSPGFNPAIHLCGLADLLSSRSVVTGVIGHIDSAIENAQQAVNVASEADPNYPIYLTVLGEVLGRKFDMVRRLEDIDKAIAMQRKAIKMTPPTNPALSHRLNRLVVLCLERFKKSTDPKDLKDALGHTEEILQIVSEDSPEYAINLNNKGNIHLQLYQQSGLEPHLDSSIKYTRQAVAKAAVDHQSLPAFLVTLGTTLSTKFERTGGSSYLREAIENTRKGIEMSKVGSPGLPVDLYNLSVMLFRLYESGSLEFDLRDAIRVGRDAGKLMGLLTPYRANNLGSLCGMHTALFSLSHDVIDVYSAIEYGRAALKLHRDGPRDKSMFLNSLSNALFVRFETEGSEKDLAEAIELGYAAIQEPNDLNQPKYLTNLANKLRDKCFRSGNRRDIDEAVVCNKRAVKALPSGHPDKIVVLGNLCLILHELFHLNGLTESLSEAIQSGHGAIEATEKLSPGHRALPGILNNLGSAYTSQFERTGNLQDIDKAISYGRDALEGAPLKDPMTLVHMINLARSLRLRFDFIGGLGDIDEAITLGEKVVGATSSDHSRRAIRLDNLSTMLNSRYSRSFQADDITNAIKHEQEAISVSAAHLPGWATLHHNLGLLQRAKFLSVGSVSDVNDAVESIREAVKITPQNDPLRDIYLASLGGLLHLRFNLSGSKSELDEAIQNGQEALNIAPLNHPRRALFLHNIGNWLQLRASRFGQDDDLVSSKARFTEALEMENAAPFIRIRAGRSVASLYIKNSDWHNADKVLGKTINLLPRLTTRSLSRDDHQHALSQLSGLATLAASCALQANKSSEDAFQLLETGRGVISGLVINGRNDVSELEKAHPKLAAEYRLLREQISDPLPTAEVNLQRSENFPALGTKSDARFRDMQAARVELRRRDISKLDQLEAHIRSLEGFDRFQRTPSLAKLSSLASKHPIVAINVTEVRSDAFILTESGIRSIPLPAASYSQLKTLVEKLIGERKLALGLMATRSERNGELRTHLKWLWDTIVKPILIDLKLLSTKSTTNTPRLLWLANGLAGLCPLHAAGTYDGISIENTSAHVTSTYITTLKALSYTRESGFRPLSGNEQKMMVAAMSKTVGQRNLSADEEAKAITKSFEAFHLTLPTILPQPSKESVLEAIKQSSIAHFACHGNSDSKDPSNSGLLLADSIKPGVPDRLTIRDLLDVKHQLAQLAYLSACSTAENSAENLIDEVVHVASAFQLLGFPHVIGTMWEAGDKAAVDVAKVFYQKLIKAAQAGSGGTTFNEMDGHAMVAYALHDAVRSLREVKRPGSRIDPKKDVLAWAPFIHVGA